MRVSRLPSPAQRSLLACLVALLLASRPAVGAAYGQVGGHVEGPSIENGLLRIVLDQQDGKLLELVDLEAKHNHGRQAILTPEQAKTFRWETLAPKQTGLRLIWNGFALPEASECEVEVTVRLDDGKAVSRWEIAVKKPAGLGLEEIRFPHVCGLRRQADERLAVPVWMGQQTANPREALRGSAGRGRRSVWRTTEMADAASMPHATTPSQGGNRLCFVVQPTATSILKWFTIR